MLTVYVKTIIACILLFIQWLVRFIEMLFLSIDGEEKLHAWELDTLLYTYELNTH